MNPAKPLGVLAALLAACGPALAAEAGERDDVLVWARGFMTGRGQAPRQANPGDRVSRFGTLLDRSCLVGLQDDQRQRYDRALLERLDREAESQFNADLAASLGVIRACQRSFPEFRGFLMDAVSILHRAVVYCKSAAEWGAEGGGLGTVAYAHPIHHGDTPESHGRAPGLPARAERTYYIMIRNSLADFHQNWDRPIRLETYFHESLHYAGLNSRASHNVIETVPYDQGKACRPNELDDRIIFIVAACGFPGHASLDQIGDRIRRCREQGREPLWRGCMQTLMETSPNPENARLDPHYYGRPLSEPEARIVCRKIEAQTAGPMAAAEALRDAGPIIGDLLADSAATLMTDKQVPAARYLAPLSEEDRLSLNSDPHFRQLALACRAQEDGSLDVVHQDYDCPLRRGHALYPLTERLARFNNEEAELNAEARRLLGLLTAEEPPPREALSGLKAEAEALFSQRCPARPGPGDFLPRACRDGRARLLRLIAILEVNPGLSLRGAAFRK